MRLSIVIPVFNEEGNLAELYRRIKAVVQTHFPSYEILFVDDRSTDGSWSLIRSLHDKDPQCKGIRLSRNSGEHIAVSAGLELAGGEYVVIMDGDLQDQPEHIPLLFSEVQKGHDVVYAIRKNRTDGMLKSWSSSLFWFLLRKLTALDIPGNQATLRIMTKRFRDALCALPERNRFVYGLGAVVGFSQSGVEVEQGRRGAGRSGYSLSKLFALAATSVTSLSTFPLLLSFYVGLLCTVVAVGYALYGIAVKVLYGTSTEGWASLMTAVVFMGGVQMMMIGILGIYLGRNYIESKKRPLYFISDTTERAAH